MSFFVYLSCLFAFFLCFLLVVCFDVSKIAQQPATLILNAGMPNTVCIESRTMEVVFSVSMDMFCVSRVSLNAMIRTSTKPITNNIASCTFRRKQKGRERKERGRGDEEKTLTRTAEAAEKKVGAPKSKRTAEAEAKRRRRETESYSTLISLLLNGQAQHDIGREVLASGS